MKNFLSKVRGCFYAGAIGDALGFAYEYKTQIREVSFPDIFTFTDDTELTSATAEAIFLNKGRVSPEAIAANLAKWHKARRINYIGSSTLKALNELSMGGHWALVGRKGEHAAGNGAAIRIAPLIFFLNPTTESDKVIFRDICRITHHSDEAYAGALAIALALHSLIHTDALNPDIFNSLPDTQVKDRLLTILQKLPKTSLQQISETFGNSGYVVESVLFAVFAVLKYIDILDMYRDIILYGDDTDSNCFLAGQVFGAKYGIEGIPANHVKKLEASTHKQIIEQFITILTVPA